ncbi:MAG: phosphoribosylglycinamide formyltransferase [Methanocellales archaeon]|nr:phosphoribosylglycinamide formyltransferase [Methanocellales archaeon]MDD3420879.1 phosphoribosylglycinamide formyltransferase [Methanocellales archaeon]MDD4898518.1 phosphoribosylglycinamide formyltransferase [Methanocellales archaeon]MDD5446888.1 phosphoribosylglycinamide formyltransferase [Methanocellales archaeon]
MRKIDIGILASASSWGGNLAAIIEGVKRGELNVNITVVICDGPNAHILDMAKGHNIRSVIISPDGKSGVEYDEELISCLNNNSVNLVVMDGYMRVLSPRVISAYRDRIMNVHPALLPSFPGLNAWQQALDYGVKISGCTIHFADENVDCGPIILQSAVPVRDDDTVESLRKRILKEETRLYIKAIKLFADGRLRVSGRKVVIDR